MPGLDKHSGGQALIQKFTMWLLLESTVTENRSVSMFFVRLAAPHPLPRMTSLDLVDSLEAWLDMPHKVPGISVVDQRNAVSPSFTATLRFIVMSAYPTAVFIRS